jgi:heme-degrading monooxygenase HmoA
MRPMYARVSTYELEPGRRAEASGAFAAAIERIRDLDGLVEAYFLVESDDRRAITVTLWDSLDTMERSTVTASRARTDAAREVGATVVSTCEYEVGAYVGPAALAGRSTA